MVMISVSWEAKTELALLCIVTVSYAGYVVGTFLPPTDKQQAMGITGYTWETFKANIGPAFYGESFISVFAIYFPSITGIMAGAGISGELKSPDTALPKGTLLGILLTTCVYVSGIWFTGSTCVR